MFAPTTEYCWYHASLNRDAISPADEWLSRRELRCGRNHEMVTTKQELWPALRASYGFALCR